MINQINALWNSILDRLHKRKSPVETLAILRASDRWSGGVLVVDLDYGNLFG